MHEQHSYIELLVTCISKLLHKIVSSTTQQEDWITKENHLNYSPYNLDAA
jgi:hypothetical protein